SPDEYRRMLSDASWNLLATPGWDEPSVRTIRAGEVMAMPLLTNNTTGQRIVDYVTVQELERPAPTFATANTPPREFSFATGTARDFRAEDAGLRLRAPRVSVNGKLDPSSVDQLGEVSGVAVWFYLPMRGRFLLSLSPRPDLGFQKAGEIRGTTLSFSIGGDNFNLVAASPIAPGE